RLALPLPAEPGVSTVRVVWQFEEPAGPFDRPEPVAVRLEAGDAAVPQGATLWTVRVPAGYHLDPAGVPPGAIAPADRDGLKALALAGLRRMLLERSPEGSGGPAADRLAARIERLARLALLRLGNVPSDKPHPALLALHDLPRSPRTEPAAVAPPFGDVFARGRAVTWPAEPDAPPPRPELRRDAEPLGGPWSRTALLV